MTSPLNHQPLWNGNEFALLLATKNKAKLKELKDGCQNYFKIQVKIISLEDIKLNKEVPETGKTFKENALLKAKYYGELTGLKTIADDGGLTIPSLNNEPGVKSRRWLGRQATDEELINHTLLQLSTSSKKDKREGKQADRMAFLHVCLCFYDPKAKIIIFSEEKIKGSLADKPSNKRLGGYPFRSLFIVDKFDKYYDELTKKEHQQINHRLKALKRLTKKVKDLIR